MGPLALTGGRPGLLHLHVEPCSHVPSSVVGPHFVDLDA
jgi:hypothetical protein